MPPSRVTEVQIAAWGAQLDPKSGYSEINVLFEGGGASSFIAATPDQPGLWIDRDKTGWSFGLPVLFVKRLDKESVEAAVASMAGDMGGYWLRYYNSPPQKHAGKAPKPFKVASAALSDVSPPRKPENGCAVSQVIISDGREFSLLTSTPAWFEKTFESLALPFYFGSSFLFVRKLDQALVRKAVKAMAEEGDRLLCLYDTPRRTLPEVLADFKARHAGAQA